MKAKSISALLISGSLAFATLFLAAPAKAVDSEDNSESTEVVQSRRLSKSFTQNPTPRPGATLDHWSEDHDDENSDDSEDADDEAVGSRIKKKYGSRDHLSVPPMVVKLGHEDEDEDNGDDESSEEDSISSSNSIESASRAVTAGDSLSVSPPKLQGATVSSGAANASNSTASVAGQSVVIGQQMDLTKVRIQSKTPAERFLDAALFGLAAMAAGAIALGAMAASKVLRRR